MNVTRDVIRDLSGLIAAGEASDDSRKLVDAYLAQDAELATSLRAEGPALDAAAVKLPADHEVKTLSMMKKRLERRSPLRIVALGLTGLTIARLIEQTTFTQSPTEVIALAITATVAWILYSWHTRYLLRRGVFGEK